jgi:adenylate cyclase
MRLNLRAWRGNLRLGSGLILLAFVICHLAAHSFLLLSFSRADAALEFLMTPWRTFAGTSILAGAFLVHYTNALWSIYARRSLRFSQWEWWQLALGLCIPVLLMGHVASTRIAEILIEVSTSYYSVLVVQWLVAPWLGAIHMAAVVIVWIHACIGIHFWLRTKTWYPDWQVYFAAFALLLPTLGLAGYVTAGNQILRESLNPEFVRTVLMQSNLTEQTLAEIERIVRIGWSIHFALLALVFGARGMRAWISGRRRRPMLTHASGRRVPILLGATVLETLRDHGIPHASVCGGRARCTTCRIHVTKGLVGLPPPEGLEAKALM